MTNIIYSSRDGFTEKASLAPNLILAKIAVEFLREWWRRYQSRWELALLSFDERKDLGFSANIDAEVEKPFWRK